MQKNALKMTDWFLCLAFASLLAISECRLDVLIDIVDSHGSSEPSSSTIETVLGSNLLLRCSIQGNERAYNPDLIWGRRSKELRFKDEADLLALAQQYPEHIRGNTTDTYHTLMEVMKRFAPLRRTDRGVYFCLSLKYMRARIVHIKVNELWSRSDHSEHYANSIPCKDFRCTSSGICITSHYTCDGHPDCLDHSDEDWEMCGINPCNGKIPCPDGRCIPTSWCCDKRTDMDCTVDVRPSCCPILPDPYDPIHWYYNNKPDNKTDSNVKEFSKGQGSRFLFITICVISAILSFILFLFIISKICGLDSKSGTRPRNHRHQNEGSAFTEFNRCGHSECSIQREFGPNVWCLYRATATNNVENNNEVSDPLIMTVESSFRRGSRDEPPPYSEVVNSSNDKSSLDELFNAPPPPYPHIQFTSENTNGIGGGNNNNTDNNVDQRSRCDNSNA